MSKKPLADDRRRDLATETFAKLVRATFKGEADKVKDALAIIDAQCAEEIDIHERAHRFAAMSLNADALNVGKPRNIGERLLSGIMALNAGSLDAAEKDVAAVITEQPGNADAHYALAIIHARRENADAAVASLKTACSLSPARAAQAALDGEFSALAGNPAFDALSAA
jgi:predicted Zn-dependent protease